MAGDAAAEGRAAAAAAARSAHSELFKLNLDVATREVVEALRAEGIPSILLRGPAIMHWLYDDRGRTYSDIDLLVPPERMDAIERIVAALGFVTSSAVSSPYDRPHYDTEWFRQVDGVRLELHTSLSGVGAPAERAWEILSAETETMPLEVDDYDVQVLTPAARAAAVALHAAHHGPTLYSAREDLRRALERVPLRTWDTALELAQRLDAVPAFATGIRLDPAGAEFAASRRLSQSSREAELLSVGAPPMSLMLDWLARTPGVKAKVIFLVRELFPPRDFMRIRSELAQRGRLGLAAAYAQRPFSLLRRFGPALLAWRRAGRRTR